MNAIVKPNLLTLIPQGIDRRQITRDILSGIVVGIAALPLAIAFPIASGVSPERRLITAILAVFLISLLGRSRVQTGGPTGAQSLLYYELRCDCYSIRCK